MKTTAVADAARNVSRRVGETLRRQQTEYSGEQDRPLGGYVRLMGVYGGMCAALALAARATGATLPERFAAADLALISVATHRLSRMVSKDPVTSPLRSPFTRYQQTGGPSELAEQARGDSPVRHSVGELLTCPFCTAQWIATGFVAGLVLAPRPTRAVASVFATVAASDFLQFAHAAAERAAEG